MLLQIISLFLFTSPFTIMALGTLQGNNSTNSEATLNNTIPRPDCPTKCGNITVPYPFGIGKYSGCSLDPNFYVTCNSTYDPPKLFLTSSNLEINNISNPEVAAELRLFTTVAYTCYTKNGGVDRTHYSWTNLAAFKISAKNKLTVIGCDDYSLISATNEAYFSSGCFGLCSKAEDVPSDGQCSGMGCCQTQTSLPKGIYYYNVTHNSLHNHTNVWPFNRCGYAFLGEKGSFSFRGARDLSDPFLDVLKRIESTVPVVLDWVIAPTQNCSDLPTVCKENSECYDADGGGYLCRCNKGYQGNPYLHKGCQDINECEAGTKYFCHDDCVNTPGSYNCTCPRGFIGDGRDPHGCLIIPKNSKFSTTIFIIDKPKTQ